MAAKMTQHIIAEKLGVSIGTVDRALHDRPGINAQTKQKILDFVRQSAYKPDRIASSLARKAKPTRIGVILQSEPEFFWSRVRQGVQAAASELADYGVDLTIRTTASIRKPAEIAALLRKYINESADAVVLVPANDAGLRVLIDEATEKGIRIITLNDDIEQSKRLFYVGPQMRQGGRIAGELMGRYLGETGHVAIVNGSIDSVDYSERIAGFKAVLDEQFPEIRVASVYRYDSDHLKENLDRVIQSFVDSADNIAGIYDVDGATLYQIGDYVRKNGLFGRFVIVGHELWDRVEKLIEEDIIQVCINQDPFAQGYYAVKLLVNTIHNGYKPDQDRLYTRADIVIKENLPSRENVLNPFVLSKALY